MSIPAQQPATTPIPVQLSANACTACILPPLSMPRRGPECTLGYHGVFNLIVWVLYTRMQWTCLPVPHDTHGKPAMHSTTVCRVFATWADDGSLWQAFLASVRHLAVAQHLDTSVLHGDGTNPVANKGGLGSGTQGTNTSRASKSSPSRTPTAMSALLSLSLLSMQRIWCCSRRVCKR